MDGSPESGVAWWGSGGASQGQWEWVKFLHVGEQELWIRSAGKVTPCEAAGTGLVVLRGSPAHCSRPQLQRHGY